MWAGQGSADVALCVFQGQQPRWTSLLNAMQASLPFPFTNTTAGPPFERLVALAIASKTHLFSAGISNVRHPHPLQICCVSKLCKHFREDIFGSIKELTVVLLQAMVRHGICTWSDFLPNAAMSSLLGDSAFKVRALNLAQDSHQLLRSKPRNSILSPHCVTYHVHERPYLAVSLCPIRKLLVWR